MRINIANIVSIVRIFLAFFAAYLLLEVGGRLGSLIAVSIVLLAVLLDAIDGKIAQLFNSKSKIGELSDLYADHIVANILWVTLSVLGLISVWIPLITTTRDFIVDWFRQVGNLSTGLNGFEQVGSSRIGWIVSSRATRAFYGGLKICAWSGIILSIFMPIGLLIQSIVWTTVVVCLIRAVPCLIANWRYVIFYFR